MEYAYLKKKKLPDHPGVYIFKKGREIVYVGKATSLRDRVRSYFGADLIKTRGPRLVDMVSQATTLSFEKTESVLEALLLESALIKKHQPRYNIKEKDDRSYNLVIVTDEEYPRVLAVRSREINFISASGEEAYWQPIKEQFGPFPDGGQLREALRIIQRIFPFFDTKKPVRELNLSRDRSAALNVRIGLYPDTFSGAVSLEEYRKTIKNIVSLFEGKMSAVRKDLEKEMKARAKKKEFEKAQEIKQVLYALDHIKDISLIRLDTTDIDQEDQDVRIEAYDVSHMSGTEVVGVMTVYEDGEPKKSEYRKFKISIDQNNDIASLLEMIKRRMNHSEWRLPHVIVIDGGETHRRRAEKLIHELYDSMEKKPPAVVSVVKDERHKAKSIIGKESVVKKYKKQIVAANNEAHRFAVSYQRHRRRRLIDML